MWQTSPVWLLGLPDGLIAGYHHNMAVIYNLIVKYSFNKCCLMILETSLSWILDSKFLTWPFIPFCTLTECHCYEKQGTETVESPMKPCGLTVDIKIIVGGWRYQDRSRNEDTRIRKNKPGMVATQGHRVTNAKQGWIINWPKQATALGPQKAVGSPCGKQLAI